MCVYIYIYIYICMKSSCISTYKGHSINNVNFAEGVGNNKHWLL